MTRSIVTAFPAFVGSCTALHDLLVPCGLVVLVLSFGWRFWAGPISAPEIIRFIVKLFLIVLLISHTHALINAAQTIVTRLTEEHVPARPENVAARYQEKLAQAQNAPQARDRSFLGSLFSDNWFESIIFAVLTLISWLAMALMFFIYSVQRVVLMVCWVLSPLLFATFAIGPVSNIGLRHLLRIIGVILWPLGLALAATFTDGLIDAATDQSFLVSGATMGWLGYGLQNLLAVTVIAIWIIFSSVLAPMMIQRLIVGSPGPASVLSSIASLATTTALPLAAGLAASVRLPSWRAQFPSSSYHGSQSTPSQVSTPPRPLPATPVQWQPRATDPTGDAQARALVDQLKTR